MTRIISSPQRDILVADRPRPIDTWRTSAQTRPRLPSISEASGHVDGAVIIAWWSRTMASKRRCRMTICSRSVRRTMSIGSTSAARSGRFSTSSLMRASNITFPPTIPTLRPKLRKVPRRSDSMAMAASTVAVAMCQQHPQFLTAYRLHMHRTIKPRPRMHTALCRAHRCGPSDLRLQHHLHVPRL